MALRRFGGKVHKGRTSWWSGIFRSRCGLVVSKKETRGVWFANRPSCQWCRMLDETGL